MNDNRDNSLKISDYLNSSGRFRPMTRQDLDAVVEIESLSHFKPWTWNNFRDSLNSGNHCLIYEQNQVIIGYSVTLYALDEAHLLNLAISPIFRRLGLGRSLLLETLFQARLSGMQHMYLEVRISNAPAIMLYESIGFNEFSTRKAYYSAQNGREDAVLMSMVL